MTDYIGNILSQMSSAFNQTTQSEEVSITADKTLKWRGLHNNQYASKDGRLISRRSKRIKNELIDGSDEYVPGSSDSISGDIDDEEKNNDNNIDDSKLVNATSTPYATLPIETILSVENQDIPQISSQAIDENASNTVTSDKKNITIDKVNLDDKKTTKLKINKCIDKSDRNLRSKNFDVFSSTSLNVSTTTTTTSMATTSQYVNNMIITTTIIASKSTDNTFSDDVLNNSEANKIRKNTRSRVQSTAIKVENYLPSSTGTDDKSSEIKEESTIISKKRGRKKITNDETHSQTTQMETPDVSNGCVIKSEIDEYVADASVAQPLEISTENIKESVSDTDITIPVVDESAPIPETETIEKTIKKRGRKPKIQITSIVKKSSRLARDAGESILASAIARREKINEKLTATPTSRLSRRIKPTAKILANEELRQGFELHNNARISLTSERNIENDKFLEQNKPKEVLVNMKASTNGLLASDKNTARTQNNNNNISNTNTSINSHKYNTVHTKNAAPKSNNTTIGITRTLAHNLGVDNIYPNVEHLDSEKFLNVIKTSSKVNPNVSSGNGGITEDSTKLKKKQQKRLAKLKEKHFHQLGLRKTNISSDSDTDTDGNDNFVPTKKINVGKPGVTLRIRNDTMPKQHKQQSQPSQQQNQNRLKNQSMRITIAPGTSENSVASRNCNKLKRPDYFVKYYQPKKQKTCDNSMTKHDTAIPMSKLICLCQEKTQYYVNKSMETSYCSGVDHIGKKKIGCNIELKGEILNLARSSVRTSYMVLCDSHLNRLKAHNCCAGCGIFCTQVEVFQIKVKIIM